MLAINVILLLLPAIAYCRISIRITPGKTEATSFVFFSGSDTSIISERERKSFKLDDTSLNNAVYAYKGNRCTDVFVKEPTSQGNVYTKYKWDMVERTLRPISARIIGINSKPVAVGSAEYINNHDKIEAVYSTSVTQSVEETVSHGWSSSGELTVGQEINYQINVGVASGGGTSSLSYTSGWGEENTEYRTVTLGTTSTILATVPPGERVVATLNASQGTMEVEITYEATVSGDVFCNYAGAYMGHHYWAYSLLRLQSIAKLPQKITSTERISVGFYTDARLEISNGNTTTEKPAEILEVGVEEKSK